MKTYIGYGLLAFVVIFALSWAATGNDFFLYKFFAPKQESVRRQVFEQTKSYNQGMVQELQNMQFAYVRADSTQRAALKSIILHRAADYDTSKLPADLRSFIESLKNAR